MSLPGTSRRCMRAAGAAVNYIARIAGITSIILIKINVRASDGQVPKHREIDSVLGKTLCVLGHAELFEPVRNFLHRGGAPQYRAHPPASASLLGEAAKQ
jgi:hypothetical protein